MQTSKPEVNVAAVAGQQHYGDTPFPLVLVNSNPGASLAETCAWLGAQRVEHDAELHRVGAILYRGFPVRTAEDFDAFVRALDYPNFTYAESLSNAVRVNRTERVFTANEAPPDTEIFFHHEMAQTPIYPSRLLFLCEQAADEAGETPLCRSDVLLERLRDTHPDFVSACETRGVRYTNTMPADDDPESGQGRSWMSTLGVTNRVDAERRLQELGYDWEWTESNSLRATSPVLPAVRVTADGRPAFFNQLIAAYRGWQDAHKSVTFGDGAPLDAQAMDAAIALSETLAFDLPWQSGDVALVDNFLVMHGRRPFKGTRRVLASLVA